MGEAVHSSCRIFFLLAATAALAAGQENTTHKSVGVEQFPLELIRSFRNIFRQENVAPFAIGTVVTGLSAIGERDVERYFAPTRRIHEYGDTGEAFAGPLASGIGAGSLFIAGQVSGNQRFRAMTYSIAQATVLSAGLAVAAKSAVHRERPNGENDRSFYSGHTSNAFAWAAVIDRYYGRRASIPAYTFAALIGMSRIEKNKHYLTDVTAGAAIGYILGKSVCRARRVEDSRVGFGFWRMRGGGVRLSVRITLR
jgi:hypothetical protein